VDRRSFLLDSSALFFFPRGRGRRGSGGRPLSGGESLSALGCPSRSALRQPAGTRGGRGQRPPGAPEDSAAEIIWQHDEPALLLASRFKAQNRLSLADALIAGLASQRSAVLVHKDLEFEALNGALDLEALPYK
jgi:hypothetical protein